jgi:hypothetical protein
VSKDNPPGIFDRLGAFLSKTYSSRFTVDAITGEITERDMGKELIVTPALPVP